MILHHIIKIIATILMLSLMFGCGGQTTPIGELENGRLMVYKESNSTNGNGEVVKVYKTAVWEFKTLEKAESAIKKLGLKINKIVSNGFEYDLGERIDRDNNSKSYCYKRDNETDNNVERCNIYLRNDSSIKTNNGVFQEMDLHLQQSGIGEKVIRDIALVYVIHFTIVSKK